MASGVRNLRAMFENKDTSTSPPDRGRSPAGSIGGASSGTSPRPLSKVRTSFVTVERSGQLGSQLGLKRETGVEPSMAKRRTSFSIDESDAPIDTAERKQSIAEEFAARKNSILIDEIIPENALQTPQEEKQTPIFADVGRGRDSTRPSVEEKRSAVTSGSANRTTNDLPKQPATNKSSSNPKPKPAPISTPKMNNATKNSSGKTKSPLPKTPTTPKAKSTKPPGKQPTKKPSSASLAPSQISKPSSVGPARIRIQPSPPQTGFHKPKPRSPTRPVRLPASLTSHTASSGSKTSTTGPASSTGGSRRSLSRSSGNNQPASTLQSHTALSRSPNRTSTSTASKSSLTRKPSSLNKTISSRPSLGPPPTLLKKQSSRQSLPQQTAHSDEGFLTRMMRPTTSSASKTLEKASTPPKRMQVVKKHVPNIAPPNFEGSKHATQLEPETARAPNPKRNEQKAVLATVNGTGIKSPAQDVKSPDLDGEVDRSEPQSEKTAEERTPALDQATGDYGAKPVVVDEQAQESEARHLLAQNITSVPGVDDTEAGKDPISPQDVEEEVDVSRISDPVEKNEPEAAVGTDSQAVATKDKPTESERESTEAPFESETSIPVEVKSSASGEDPEDAIAREEIERLNSDMTKVSVSEPLDVIDTTESHEQ